MEFDDGKTKPLVFCGFALLFSVPFHVVLIIILIRNRKTPDFLFPFFPMLLSLSVNDLVTAIVIGISSIMFLLPPKIIVQYMNPSFHIIQDVFMGAGLAGDEIILVAIGFNRLLAYVFPLRVIWRPIHTKCVIVLQWVYAVSFGMSCIPAEMHGEYYINETTEILMGTIPDSPIYLIKFAIDFITNLLAGLILVVVYSICVGKLVYHKLSMNFWQESNSLAAEARLSLQGLFLSSSLLICSFMIVYAVFMSFIVSSAFFSFFFIVAVSSFIFGPFIVIVMSSVIREYIKKMFKFNSNAVQALPLQVESKV